MCGERWFLKKHGGLRDCSWSLVSSFFSQGKNAFVSYCEVRLVSGCQRVRLSFILFIHPREQRTQCSGYCFRFLQGLGGTFFRFPIWLRDSKDINLNFVLFAVRWCSERWRSTNIRGLLCRLSSSQMIASIRCAAKKCWVRSRKNCQILGVENWRYCRSVSH